MRLLLQFSSLAVALAASSAVAALPCVVFDNQFNLYAFGGSKDWSLGQQDSWPDAKANALEAAGRPPFNTDNARCFLAQFFNSLYVLGADSQNPSDVHIFDFGARSWSTQKTSAAMDPTATILDRDTNVFFSLTNGQLSQLDLGSQTRAAGGTTNWDTVGPPNFDTTSYTKPVLALAQNHIHFLGVPGLNAGQASIFVIHFAFFQPARQDYPVYEGASGNTFPNSAGQVVSIFQGEDHVQEQFAFFPDDNSNTYFVDVQRNRTLPLAAPSDRTAKSSFTASQTSVVHLSQSGSIYYLPVNPDAFNPDSPNPSLMSDASWTKLKFSELLPVTGTTAGSIATGNSTKPSGTTTPGGNSGTSKPDSAGSMLQASVMLGFATAIFSAFLAATTSVF